MNVNFDEFIKRERKLLKIGNNYFRACVSILISLICEVLHRIDGEGVIKVGDFGLSEYVYEKQSFRQNITDNLKLPIKWMALESMENAVFTEKSDVVRIMITKVLR